MFLPLFPRKFSTLTTLCAAVLAIFLACESIAEPAPRPAPTVASPRFADANVLLIVLDTVRTDALSCCGGPEGVSPEIDRLASESLLFENGIAVSSWTLPTHASILTGLYPRSHGAQATKDGPGAIRQRKNRPVTALKPAVSTLAEVLAANGYETAAFFSNYWWLRPIFGIHQGFQTFFSRGPNARVQDADSPLGAYQKKFRQQQAQRVRQGKAIDSDAKGAEMPR